MASGLNSLNDVSVTGLVSIEADSVASGIIVASEIIVDGVNITDLLDDLENQIDTNATNIAQLQTDVSQLQSDVSQLQSDVSYLENNAAFKNVDNTFTANNTFKKPVVLDDTNAGNRLISATYYRMIDQTSNTSNGLINSNLGNFVYDCDATGGEHQFFNNNITNPSVQVNTMRLSSENMFIYTANMPQIPNASLPTSSDASSKVATTQWVQNAINFAGLGSLSTNNIWTGTNTYTNIVSFTGPVPLSSGTQPSVSDSSTKVPNTQWVQGAIDAKIPFAPRFYNYQVLMPGNVAYTQGLRIDFSGNWSERDYFMISVRAQHNYAGSSAWPPVGLQEWQDYATAVGEIIFRPYYTPVGTWGINSPYNFWPTNNGSIFGNVKKFMYTTNATLNGNNGFIAAGSGTSGGLNATGFVNLRCLNYGGFNQEWAYTCSVEYISIYQDTPGSGHVFFTATPQYGGLNAYLS